MADAASLLAAPAPATVGAALDALEQMLSGPNREPRREAREIIAALLDVPRSWPSANRDAECERLCYVRAATAVFALHRGAPFAYAVGRACFRHLTLDVDERVLIPRPETELLVDIVLGAGLTGGTAIDVGTGSGAIALALASEGSFERVIATDVSLDALAVARGNARLHAAAMTATVEFRHGSLTAPVRGERARVLVSNPPYIALSEAPTLPSSVRDWEPSVALFSGSDGMPAIAALVREAHGVLEPGGLLALEVDARRASLAAELAMADGRYRDVSVRLDLAGRERFVTAYAIQV